MIFVYIAIIVSIIIVIILLSLAYEGSTRLIVPKRMNPDTYVNAPKKPAFANPGELEMPFENIFVTGQGNVKLHAWFIPQNNYSAPTIIMIHGIHLSRFYLLPFAKELHNQGFQILLLDNRGHGDSEGEICTYGMIEQNDIILWNEWIINRVPNSPLGIWGISYGSIVTLYTSPKLKNIKALVLQSPYTNLFSITKWIVNNEIKFVGRFLMPFLDFWVKKRAHLNMKLIDPGEKIKSCTIPKMIIVGLKDEVIPAFETLTVFKNGAEPKELFEIAEAGHNNIHKIEPNYFIKIGDFFKKNLK